MQEDLKEQKEQVDTGGTANKELQDLLDKYRREHLGPDTMPGQRPAPSPWCPHCNPPPRCPCCGRPLWGAWIQPCPVRHKSRNA